MPMGEYQKLITITSDVNVATKNRPNGPQGWSIHKMRENDAV